MEIAKFTEELVQRYALTVPCVLCANKNETSVMKIAILTQPLRTNFGGILQDYALQTVLKRMGHEPVTVDYDCVYPWWRWMLGRFKSLVMRTSHHIQYPHYGRSGQENLNRFIHEKMTITKPEVTITKELLESLHPDAILVGSDQVWSPWCNVPIKYLGNMFLDFWPDFPGKRVAYAASFGGSEWIYTPEQEQLCGALAKKFDSISVREASGVQLCKEHFGVEATHVLDPTLLLTAKDYESLLSRQQNATNTLLAYVLDASLEKITFLERMAKKYNLELKIKGANDDISWDDSIEDWLSEIRDAAMVVTDSFHGSVFAIQFHRPFLSIVNKRRGAERFVSLLSRLELEDRLVYDATTYEPTNHTINWNEVDACLAKEREMSMEFLKDALR